MVRGPKAAASRLRVATRYEAAGLARDALYLLRPDTYVALADGAGAADVLERYFKDQGIKLPPRNAP